MKELINKSLLFSGRKDGEIICSGIFDKIKLSELDFSERFVKSINSLGELSNLTDLLNTDQSDFLNIPKCGIKTIQDSRSKISEWFNKNEIEEKLVTESNVQRFPFLNNLKFNLSDNHQEILNLDLSALNFETRFLDMLDEAPEINTVGDLLKRNFKSFSYRMAHDRKAINTAQKLLTFLLRGKLKIPSSNIRFIFEQLNNNDNIEIFSNNDELMNSDPGILEFETRFDNIIRSSGRIKTLRDLMGMNPYAFQKLRCCGPLLIRKAQDHIINLFTGKYDMVSYKDKKIDESILLNLRKILKNERYLNIFLRYYNYKNEKKLNLSQVGVKFGITRERVRQIVITHSEKILKHLQIFDDLVKEMKSFGYIFKMGSFINYLTKNNLWEKENKKFAETLINEFIIKRFGISLNGKYIMTINIDNLLPVINLITESISDRIKVLQTGIDAEEMTVFLKENIKVTEDLNPDILFSTDLITFISEKNKNFHVVENKIYNEMMFQIFFGKVLKNVIYHSLKQINEPIHFSQLGEYIRKNNTNHRRTKDETIHFALVTSELFMLAAYRKYVLSDSRFERYRSASDAIVLLLKDKGALTRKEIIENLSKKYNYNNLMFALQKKAKNRLKIKGKRFELKSKL